MDTEEILKHLNCLLKQETSIAWQAETVASFVYLFHEKNVAALRYAIADQKAKQRVDENASWFPLNLGKRNPFYAEERG